MWAPWRIGYITGERPQGCVFCDMIGATEDERNHVLYRGEQNVVVLNAYPYSNGHVMVVPHAHVAELTDLRPEARAEMWELTLLVTETLKTALGCQGLNIGVNLGQAAGAGIDDHLHLHVVPRWNGDTNFMSAVADTRVAPQDLDDSFRQLQPVMHELAAKILGG